MMSQNSSLPLPGFSMEARIHHHDTDASGVVHHASYLEFLEAARAEWLRSLGFQQSDFEETSGCVFAVQQATLKYKAPAKLDNLLTITVTVAKLRKASILFAQDILCETKLLVSAEILVVSVVHCMDGFRPTRVPTAITDKINCRHHGRDSTHPLNA